ncbi:phospholipase D family protein [Vibrio ezurae]|uniref:Phospholipase D-like domain-containing protein n=1 Tax=Vibrio ezurae NBRC 102218 TaxID=1219080 RepID=U3AZ40_9VIBR|nr:phospholipase D family protein [Vibrio ezurae]GAD79010.1 hypothetical protein VEZ01S_08_00460 [Vibrio ezurae NBRC 102218]
MKLVANSLNREYFRSLLPTADTELDGVVAAIAYGDDKTQLLQHCIDNKHRLDIWMRYDHTVPVAPSFLSKLLSNTKNNVFCKLVPDCLHSKVIWWKGYGAYVGSANLTDRAWNTNIEAGVFFSESDLSDSGMLEQLEEFFDGLEALDVAFDLTQEIIDEQKLLQKQKREREKADRTNPPKRIIPEWEGPSFVPDQNAKDIRKENFRIEWNSAISHIRNIASQINDFRPHWIEEDTPAYWQVDQFLHAYYYNKVRQIDNKYPYEEYYKTNSKDPQASLLTMLAWWKDLPAPPSDEDINLYEKAPLIRNSLSKANIDNLSENELNGILRATHATMDHLSKMSTASLGKPHEQSLSMEQRVPLFTEWLMGQQNDKGQTIGELLKFVLYGGNADQMWERIYLAGKDPQYRFKHYGINSIAEVAGWAKPEDTPPRNGRTNKALRALGYSVRVNM